MEAPTGYTIDVCLHCGAHAVWPFSCGHRSETGRWTTPVRVRLFDSDRARIQTEIDRRVLAVAENTKQGR